MELVLNNGFCELPEVDMLNITAGGWIEFFLATGGVLCIAASPIVAATGNIPGALLVAGAGCGLNGWYLVGGVLIIIGGVAECCTVALTPSGAATIIGGAGMFLTGLR